MAQTLEEILDLFGHSVINYGQTDGSRTRLINKATQAIRQAVEEIVGEDETLYTWDIYGNDPRHNIGTIEIEVVNAINRTRKSLRAEQRANLMKFIEGEK